MTPEERSHLIQPGNMTRNPNDEWQNDSPIGTFDIHVSGIQGYPEATARITFVCPNNNRCAVLLGPRFVDRPTPESACIWQWDGNIERPSLTPSINCIAKKDGKP